VSAWVGAARESDVAWSSWMLDFGVLPELRRRAHLPVRASSVRSARHFVAAALADWHLWPLAENAMLCTSELVTNAVRHALWPTNGTQPMITVIVRSATDGVVVEVGDLDARLPVFTVGPDVAALSADVFELSERGAGLQIVAGLADKVGVSKLTTGKSVWFLLCTSAAPDGLS
jgi:anti-sigma regulatory factor (Ser/Thr protein kinase)